MLGDLVQEVATQSLQAFLLAAVTLRFSSSARALASWAHALISPGVARPSAIFWSLWAQVRFLPLGGFAAIAAVRRSPALLPGLGQLPVPVGLRSPNLGFAVHLSVPLVRSDGQRHAHPDGWWGSSPSIGVLGFPGDIGPLQEPVLSLGGPLFPSLLGPQAQGPYLGPKGRSVLLA